MRLEGIQKKGWGYENIWVSNDRYCGKLLVFDKKGSRFSMHFHASKEETWYILKGKFLLTYIKTDTAEEKTKVLEGGDVWTNYALSPHQLEALEDNSIIIEVSTPDSVEDNYRIKKGDSQ